MERIRDAGSTLLLAVGSIVGFVVGGILGFTTEHGFLGLITVVGAFGGAAVGVWIAQRLLAEPE